MVSDLLKLIFLLVVNKEVLFVNDNLGLTHVLTIFGKSWDFTTSNLRNS